MSHRLDLSGGNMIKLLSFFVFVAAFLWTWFLFNSRNSIGVDIHAGIQSKLAILIEETIKKSKPNSSDFQMLRIYTEKLDDNRISAKFSFQYDDKMDADEKTTQTLSGEAILNKGLSENPEVQKWIVQSVKTNSTNLEFREGLVISSDGKTTEDVRPEEKKND
jgi:hypothetical protein